MTELLKGKDVVSKINNDIIDEVKKLNNKDIYPTLGIVRVGENPSDLAYERGAIKRAETVGIKVKQFVLPENSTTSDLVNEIESINKDKAIHGILLFRPLPKHIDDDLVRNAIDPNKDIDGISDISMAGVYSGVELGFPPCTAKAAMEILKYYNKSVEGKSVCVIGRSLVIGRPVAMMLMKENATVTICHTKTKNPKEIARKADILIAAAGKAKNITTEYVNNSQVIIDVGINFEDGKMCGDVDFEKVENEVSAITPVPGGVGTVTTSILMSHVLLACKKQA